jgi:hypothetical protein
VPFTATASMWPRAFRRQGSKSTAWLERVRSLFLRAHHWFVAAEGPGTSSPMLLAWAEMEAALAASDLEVGAPQLLQLVPSALSLLKASPNLYRYIPAHLSPAHLCPLLNSLLTSAYTACHSRLRIQLTHNFPNNFDSPLAAPRV